MCRMGVEVSYCVGRDILFLCKIIQFLNGHCIFYLYLFFSPVGTSPLLLQQLLFVSLHYLNLPSPTPHSPTMVWGVELNV